MSQNIFIWKHLEDIWPECSNNPQWLCIWLIGISITYLKQHLITEHSKTEIYLKRNFYDCPNQDRWHESCLAKMTTVPGEGGNYPGTIPREHMQCGQDHQVTDIYIRWDFRGLLNQILPPPPIFLGRDWGLKESNLSQVSHLVITKPEQALRSFQCWPFALPTKPYFAHNYLMSVTICLVKTWSKGMICLDLTHLNS